MSNGSGEDLAALKRRLKEMIVSELSLEGLTPESIADDSRLFGEGLELDSLDAVELVVLLQRNFGVKIKDLEHGREIFESLDTLADYISKNRTGGG
ncbi:MAG: hypothetical protein JW808_00390 [Victivallales bacterium]|nr:hypothetical protein [Victivallales bacterium]